MNSENPSVSIAYIKKRTENSNLSTHVEEFILLKGGVIFSGANCCKLARRSENYIEIKNVLDERIK